MQYATSFKALHLILAQMGMAPCARRGRCLPRLPRPLKRRVALGRVRRGEALVHKYAQPIEFITFFDLTQKDVTC
jgi:hypothetical protein